MASVDLFRVLGRGPARARARARAGMIAVCRVARASQPNEALPHAENGTEPDLS